MSGDPERLGATVELTLDEVLAATGGELVRLGGALRFGGVTTDSRALRPGEVFVAIRGDTHDGHRFVGDAVTRGAGVVLVERDGLSGALPSGTVVVRDTLAALGELGAFHRRRSGARVVAITGSNGKTTTKELLAAVLEHALGTGQVLRTTGTQNNLVGVPLTLLRLAGEPVAIIECGMNGPGEIWRLAQIAAPDVGVVTCVAAAHLEGLGSIEGVATAKGEMFRRLRPSATAVWNADDPHVAAQAACFSGRSLGFGTGPEAAVRAVAVEDRALEGTTFRLEYAGRAVPVRLGIPGRHNVTNALAAAAAALALDVEIEAVGQGLSAAKGAAMRMEVVRLPSGVTVLNDAYNANPASMAAALRTLALGRAPRRVAVLGDMRELGGDSEAAHRQLGSDAAEARLDALFLLGSFAGAVREGAQAAGMPPERITVAAGHGELAGRLRAFCRSGDLVLVKGSRGAAMEQVVEQLLPGS